ncbi:outer membrane protein assembly factor BamB family protein [Gorillibacterium sp. sgz500922]|uniref:outer membrane protein assembly factor BamB family protein n=1 Tax=Gorillibacterium sp. sgz500922 TaxID=3446694 RepID=UPI003F668BA9
MFGRLPESDGHRRLALLLAAVLPLTSCTSVPKFSFPDSSGSLVSASFSPVPAAGAASPPSAWLESLSSASGAPSSGASSSAVLGPAPVTASEFPVGSEWVSHAFSAFYNKPLQSGVWKDAAASFYGGEGVRFRVVKRAGEWLEVDDGSGPAWTPLWYGTKGADAISEERQALRLTLKPDAKLYLYPGSSSSWSLADRTGDTPFGGTPSSSLAADSLDSTLSWQGWRAVIVPPAAGYTGNQLNRPLLLWVRQADVASSAPLAGGLFARWGEPAEASASPGIGGMAASRERAFTEAALTPGMPADQVRRYLGTPGREEVSANLELDTQSPQRLGKVWRYEGQEAGFTVTLGPDGRLARWNWTLPLTNAAMAEISPIQRPYDFTYELRRLPIVPSRAGETAWTSRNELDYAYLVGAANGILLINGDDGGFSGFHTNSNLYALHQKTGKKLWQIDAGYDALQFALDPDGRYVTVLTRYSKEKKIYEQHVRRIRMADGKVVWDLVKPEGETMDWMAAAEGTILLYHGPEKGDNPKPGRMTAYDSVSGNAKWSRELTEALEPAAGSLSDPVLIAADANGGLTALAPSTGKTVWHADTEVGKRDGSGEEASPYQFPAAPVRPLEPKASADGWYRLGREKVLLNKRTGQVKARYTLTNREVITAIDDTHWLIQANLQDYVTGRFEADQPASTRLYNPLTGKTAWTLPGRASAGTVDGGTLYLMLDGLPAAVDLASGRLLWQAPTNPGVGNPDDFYYAVTRILVRGNRLVLPYGPDVLVLDKSTGRPLYRLADLQEAYPDLREAVSMSGLLNEGSDGWLYIGSSNGGFHKLRLPEEK